MQYRKKGDPESRVTQLLGLDFDGTLHEHDHWSPEGFGRIDVTVIHMAHQGGHVVYVLTGNDPRKVARALRAHGISARADVLMRHSSWDGGRNGRVVLVTQRKLQGTRLIADDRALNWRYGGNPRSVIEALEATLAERAVI